MLANEGKHGIRCIGIPGIGGKERAIPRCLPPRIMARLTHSCPLFQGDKNVDILALAAGNELLLLNLPQ